MKSTSRYLSSALVLGAFVLVVLRSRLSAVFVVLALCPGRRGAVAGFRVLFDHLDGRRRRGLGRRRRRCSGVFRSRRQVRVRAA